MTIINLASSLIVWLQEPRPAALLIFKVSKGWRRRADTNPPGDDRSSSYDYDDHDGDEDDDSDT